MLKRPQVGIMSGAEIERLRQDKTQKAQYREKRFERDVEKTRTALHNILASLRIEVVKSEESPVHAELQLLDYLEKVVYRTGGESRPAHVYIGVSLKCCGKCTTVIGAYNAAGFNHVIVMIRGSHSTFDRSGWKCPKKLMEVIAGLNTSEPNRDILRQIEELQLSGKNATDLMSPELSDSEDEYTPPRYRIASAHE